MSRFVVFGNRPLSGEIRVSGSKNAALPLIFASLLVRGTTTLSCVPEIEDVKTALDILTHLGASVERQGDRLFINTESVDYRIPPQRAVSKIRASSYLIGAMLSRFGRAELQRFGGCNFDNRPIDMHVYAAERFGASFDGKILEAKRLYGADVYFNKISVGATVNALIMAASAEGKSRIFGYAKEPHVISLADFLSRAGAKILITDECITVEGTTLKSASADIIPDMIEAGKYAVLSLLTSSELKISGIAHSHLYSLYETLIDGGAVLFGDSSSLILSGRIDAQLEIITAPYPAFPTDLQPLTAPLLARCGGGSITEGVWLNRFGYLNELSKFGVKYELESSRARIKPSKFNAAEVTAPDLRGGAALLLAALAADGESIIDNAELIKRGYSEIVKKLRKIGAKIEEF